MLWHSPRAGNDCLDPVDFDVVLQRADEVVHVSLGRSISRGVAFDGTAYQLFWTSGDVQKLFHQTLAEDGTLGPLHDLGMSEPAGCVSVASDRVGTTFLRADDDGFLVDTATGSKQLIWSAPDVGDFDQVFYFAGKWHVPELGALTSITPNGTYARTELPGELSEAYGFFPGASTLYARTPDRMVEVDGTLTVRQLHRQAYEFGTFNDDRVYFDQFSIDGTNLLPGYVALTRDGSTMWRVNVAVDSPVESVEECTPE